MRWLVTHVVMLVQWGMGRPRQLEPAIRLGHGIIRMAQAAAVPLWVGPKMVPAVRPVDVHDLHFSNPLTFAAYESNVELLALFFRLGMAGGCYKTMTPAKRPGNPAPRIIQTQVQGHPVLYNAMGLPGKGAAAAIETVLNSRLMRYKRPLGLSIGGDTLAAYYDAFLAYEQRICTVPHPFYYEINISCPNTKKGKALSDDLDSLEQLIRRMRSRTQRVIAVKFSPDQPNQQLQHTASLVQSYPKTMLTLGNTQCKTREEMGLGPAQFAMPVAGLSGAPLFERTMAMVQLLAPFQLPIIATGGISQADQVRACLDVGASLVGMAAALVFNPYCVPQILEDLQDQG